MTHPVDMFLGCCSVLFLLLFLSVSVSHDCRNDDKKFASWCKLVAGGHEWRSFKCTLVSSSILDYFNSNKCNKWLGVNCRHWLVRSMAIAVSHQSLSHTYLRPCAVPCGMAAMTSACWTSGLRKTATSCLQSICYSPSALCSGISRKRLPARALRLTVICATYVLCYYNMVSWS